MTTARILAIVAVLVSLPSLALAQTIVIVPSPYYGGYAQPYYGGYSYAQPYYGGYSYTQPYSGYYANAPLTMGMRRAITMAGSAGKDFGRRPLR
jgi:hypothetical protein